MQNKLKKITFEYEDHVDTLDGDDAHEWLLAANGMIAFNRAHGMSFPKFPWKSYKLERKSNASK